MTHACEQIHVGTHGSVCRVQLARPDVHNAFGPRMIAELTDAFEVAARDDGVRVVVLSGEGESFSAGADLDYMRSMAEFDKARNIADARRLAALFESIRDCPKPVVARVQGAAIGGGAGLVAACDIAVAAQGTRFAFSESRLGVVPAVISPFVIPRIGQPAARELFLTGERFGAERALAIGLVSRVVPITELDDAVEERVSALLEAAPGAQAEVKRLIAGVAGCPSDITAFTSEMIAERRASEEGREGMSAFLERRRPAWQVSELAEGPAPAESPAKPAEGAARPARRDAYPGAGEREAT